MLPTLPLHTRPPSRLTCKKNKRSDHEVRRRQRHDALAAHERRSGAGRCGGCENWAAMPNHHEIAATHNRWHVVDSPYRSEPKKTDHRNEAALRSAAVDGDGTLTDRACRHWSSLAKRHPAPASYHQQHWGGATGGFGGGRRVACRMETPSFDWFRREVKLRNGAVAGGARSSIPQSSSDHSRTTWTTRCRTCGLQ